MCQLIKVVLFNMEKKSHFNDPQFTNGETKAQSYCVMFLSRTIEKLVIETMFPKSSLQMYIYKF